MVRGRWVAACAAALVAVVPVACAPAAPPPVGPTGAGQVVSVALAGAYDYAGGGAVAGAPVIVERNASGELAGLSGSVSVPGRGARGAVVTFDLDIDARLGVASGSIDVVDPAAGLAVTTPMLAAPVTLADGSVGGDVGGQRLWRLVELLPYRLTWSVADGTGPTVAEPPLGAATSGEIDVLTYNVAGLPEPLSGSRPATNNVLISPLLEPYDLVLLQEDFFYQDRIAQHLTFPYGSDPQRLVLGSDPTRPSAIVGSGLERYSRHPFDGYRQVRWPGCYGGALGAGAADCLSQKGFSVATHHLATGVEVDVYDLHGEAGSTPEDVYWSAQDYLSLASYINANSAGRAVIVGGDFNLDIFEPVDGSVMAGLLASAGLTDVCEVQDCSELPDSIDRLLFRSSAELTLTPTAWARPAGFVDAQGEPLSDHPAISATFAWTRNG